MKTIKLLLILLTLISVYNMYAAVITLTFRETAASGVSTTTRNLVLAQNPSYPNNPPAADRWVIQVYKSPDNVIDPLGTDGLPTNGDVAAVTNVPMKQGLYFAAVNVWMTSPSMSVYDDGVTGNTFMGDKIYLRIFNSNSIATATKYFESTSLYTIPTGNITLTYIPAYGWSAWKLINPLPLPDHAELVAPTPSGTTVSNYAFGQTLEWAAGTGGAPSGYDVYFGTDSTPTNLVASNQAGTTYPTATLVKNTMYYWRVIPRNATGVTPTADCPIWSFQTRDEINPGAAINPSPSHTDSFAAPTAFPYNQTLQWEAGAGQTPTGYDVYFGNADPPTLISDDQVELSKVVSISDAGQYFWKVIPYYTDPGTRKVTYGKAISPRITNPGNTKGPAINCPTWSFTVTPFALPTYTIEITSSPSGAAIWSSSAKTILTDTGQTTPWTFTVNQGASLTYEVVMDGYNWSPTSISMSNIQQNFVWNFAGTLKTYTVDITSDPTGAAINVGGVYSGHDTPWQFTMNWHDSATYEASLAGYTFSPTILSITNIEASTSQLFTGTPVSVPDIPAGGSTDVGGGPAGGGATIETSIDLYNGPVVPGTDPIWVLLPNLNNVTSPIILSYSGAGVGNLTITVGVGTWWGLIYYGGMWHIADLPVPLPLVVMSGTGELVFNSVDFGVKGDVVLLLTEGADPTLPVELSSFTAVLTSQYFISLTWVTESETEVLGFNVYRSDNSNYADAVRLNPVIIPATNTSQQQTYTMTDTENLVTNQTYYYWLESVDIGGAAPSLHGPISALVTGQPTPTLPEVSMMRSAYPNPFRVGNTTSIDVNIKAGEAGTVTIYNILGQTVKTFNVKQGEHKLTWNAKGCASGIYFYKLSTPSMNNTKKLVIVN
jgi:hypothetical protein